MPTLRKSVNSKALTKMESREDTVRKYRLRWAGHVRRMDDTWLPKKILFVTVAGGKKVVGKSKKNWVECLEEAASWSFGTNRNNETIGTVIIEGFAKNIALLKKRKYNMWPIQYWLKSGIDKKRVDLLINFYFKFITKYFLIKKSKIKKTVTMR